MKHRYIDRTRFGSRQALLRQFDKLRKPIDTNVTKSVTEVGENYARAFDVLTSSQLVDALDVTKEDPAVRERYGKGSPKHRGDGAPMWNDQLLIARRLVEAGVPFVTMIWKKEDPELHKTKYCNGVGSWDTHGENFPCLKDILLPNFDQMFAALLEDLSDRGLIDQTLVVVTSEMGRMPRIGDKRVGGASGRDHWRQCMSVLFAGGGIRGGQVYGASDRKGAEPADNMCTPADIHATAFKAMGIDHKTELQDVLKRTFRLCDGEPLPLF